MRPPAFTGVMKTDTGRYTGEIQGVGLRVAALADVIRSKRAANRPQDRAVLEILERTHAETAFAKPSSQAGRARSRE